MTRCMLYFLVFVVGIVVGLPHGSHDVEEVTLSILRPEPTLTTISVPQASGNVTTNWVKLRGFEGCKANSRKHGTTVNWKKWIIDGFKEHDTMSIKEVKYDHPGGPTYMGYPDVNWLSAPAIEFFGPGYMNKQYRSQIQSNLDQHANMEYGSWLGWKIHVRCDDPEGICLHRTSNTEAYTIHGDGEECKEFEEHINFCPNYFKLRKLNSAVDQAAGADLLNTQNDLQQYWNRACVWAHEIMHIGTYAEPIDYTGGWMRDVPLTGSSQSWPAYRITDCKYLSYSDVPLPQNPLNNPQNYAWYMLAKYVLKKKGFYPSQNVWTTSQDPPEPPHNPQTFIDSMNGTAANNRACNFGLPPGTTAKSATTTSTRVSLPPVILSGSSQSTTSTSISLPSVILSGSSESKSAAATSA